MVAFNAGARIHSNSWGANTNSYTIYSRAVDEMVYEFPSLLVLVAAGNDGQNAGSISGTIGAPATAKNCLTIGASQTSTLGFLSSFNYTDWEVRRQVAILQLHETPAFNCCTSNSRGVEEYCCEAFNLNQVLSNPTQNDLVNVAPFSSRGPTFDGRIKPEVMAPGQNIVSAKSDGTLNTNNCGLLSSAGSSMATPIVAGSAALIQQYLMAGYYPSGAANASSAKYTSPSSALIRAMLSNGAVPLTGQIDVYNDGTDIQPLGEIYPPGIFQGFGRINLQNVLYFSTNSSFSLFLDDERSLNTSQDINYCVNVTSAGDIKVTLTWNDPPASLNAGIALVNNLDLIVGHDTNDALAGNFKTMLDERNNMEHIIFPTQPGSLLRVKVQGTNVPSGPQPYSLVIRGSFDTSSLFIEQCKFDIAPNRFQSAKQGYYFPFGPVVGGVIAAVILLAVLVFLIRWCQQQRVNRGFS